MLDAVRLEREQRTPAPGSLRERVVLVTVATRGWNGSGDGPVLVASALVSAVAGTAMSTAWASSCGTATSRRSP